MNSLRCGLVLLLVAANLGASAAEDDLVLTMPRAIALAVERNPEVQVSAAQLTEYKGKVQEVRSGAFPDIKVDGFGLRLRDPSILNSSSFDNLPPEFRNALVPRGSNLFDVGIGLKQTLYSAGKVLNGVRLAQEGEQEKSDALESVRRNIAYRVVEAFHDCLLSAASLAVVQETKAQRQKQLDLAKSRYELGVATEIDVLRSQVNLANVEPDLIRAQNRIKLTRSALNNLIVRDLDAPTEVVGRLEYHPWEQPPVHVLQEEALARRPEVLAARHVVAESRLLVRLADTENRLNVDLDTRWGFNVRELSNIVDTNFTRWNFTVNFRLPLYDGGRKAGLMVQAQSRLRAAEQSLAQLENNVKLEIQSAWDVLRASSDSIAAARLNVKQAERVLEMMQANYRYGAATTLDVIDSQTSLSAARNTENNATYIYEVAKARLRLASGRPLLDEEVAR